MRYVFSPGHQFNINVLKAGLITLLGNAVGPKEDPSNDFLTWHWSKDQVKLQYWLSTSLAGRSVIDLGITNNETHKVVRNWHSTTVFKDRYPGVLYRDGFQSVTFMPESRWTLEALIAGINTLTGVSHQYNFGGGRFNYTWPAITMETKGNKAPIKVLGFDDGKFDPLFRVIATWKMQEDQ